MQATHDQRLEERPVRGGSVRREPVLDLPASRAGRFSPPRVRLFVPSSGWGGRRRRELLASAVAVAVLFHIAMVAAVLEAPALVPAFLRPPPPKPPPPPPEAELVMVKENTPTVGGTPPPQKSPPPAPRQAPPEQAKAGGGMPAAPADAPDGPPVPPTADTEAATPGRAQTGEAAQVTPPPAPPVSPVQVNLDIDGQPGWGLVDERTLPASPDDAHINKPAAYPRAAAMRGEQGTVYLATLIAPDGHVEAVEIEQSSGYPDLDRAARNAIAAWHFKPAIRGGEPVESEMREAYHFRLVH